jgi:FG-GAP-like repeat
MGNRNPLSLPELMTPYLQIFHAEAGSLTLVQEFDDTQLITAKHMLARDVDGDGQLDLLLGTASYDVAVLLGNGGLFMAPRRLTILGNPTALGVGDLDGDGDLDIAAASIPYGDKIQILWNGEHPDACPADVNADGALNILDFVAFQVAWQGQQPGADCDKNGAFNILDFTCFQQAFQGGCP